VALSFHRPEGEATSGSTRREGDVMDLSSGHWLINPGGAGQPRDGDPRAAWLLLDLDAGRAVFRREPYDIGRTQTEIRERELPEALAARLEHGI
jgi:diadenosine tetraphosphatase ApaH/serine/threonine PP2A family protein phosphatase